MKTKTMQDHIIKGRKKISEIHKQIKLVGWKSETGRRLSKEETDFKKDFLETYGKEDLSLLVNGPAKISPGRLQNNKGNKFGNL